VKGVALLSMTEVSYSFIYLPTKGGWKLGRTRLQLLLCELCCHKTASLWCAEFSTGIPM